MLVSRKRIVTQTLSRREKTTCPSGQNKLCDDGRRFLMFDDSQRLKDASELFSET